MKSFTILHSLRFRLVLASIVVEFIMLSLLVGNSVRVMESHLIEQAEVRLREIEPLLNASLAVPLAQRDFGTIDEVLTQALSKHGIVYLVLLDNQGKVISSVGWSAGVPLPPQDAALRDGLDDGVFDTRTAIKLSGQTYGQLHLGISTGFLRAGLSSIVQQSVAIAALEMLLSFLLLTAIGYWLTRHLTLLNKASQAMAGGQLDISLPVKSDDEVGQLTRTFNSMAQALRGRINDLSEGRARFHAIADYTYDWESWYDPKGRLIWVNPSVERMTGYTPAECLTMHNFPLPLVSDEDLAKTEKEFKHGLRGFSGRDVEFRVKCKDGSHFWAAINWQPIYSETGEYMGIRSSVRDISALKEVEIVLRSALEELKVSEEMQRRYLSDAKDEQARLVSLLSAMNVGILFVGADNQILYYNPTFMRIWRVKENIDLTGSSPDEVLKYSENILSRPDHFSRHILQVLETHEVSESHEIFMADGRIVTQLSYPVRDKEGRFTGRLWLYEDVTRERQTAEQLIYLAERDSLTGLYNRHRFQEELTRMISEAERHQSKGALLFFDLDEFKYINDTFGHRAGDAMLIRVAGEVGSLVRRSEIFARLGGDEFALLLPDAEKAEIEVLAERIVRSISQIPFRFEGQNLRLTTSLGIAIYPLHATNAEELIAHADAAMYQAKESGKNAWRTYRPELDASRAMVNRLTWNDRISRALDQKLLRLHFQGVYHNNGGVLSHLEVLVRMVDEEQPDRIILPGHFIPYSEKSGKILDIDRWVISETIALLAKYPNNPPLAVNISGRSFDESTLPRFIAEQLELLSVDPRRLLVELTETAAISDLQDAERFIEALHKTGCLICLDDFGTGFSSFAYLKHLNADILKIDGLFIRDLPNDRDNQVFVKAIVDVARGMNKVTVAEFVEDAETLEMLRRLGVDLVQGYHLDMPRGDHPAVFGDAGLT